MTASATIRDPVYRIGGGVAGDMYSNNMVFFVGGKNPFSNQACGYDPVTDTYIQYPDKPTPLCNIGNFVPGTNMMYVMGGYDGTSNLTCEGMEYTMIPIPVEVEVDVPVLTEFALDQNYPNPFNPSTTINCRIPELSFITIKVYDVLGSEIITLVNEEKPAGTYEVEFNASTLPSGIYFYRLQTNKFTQVKKMILLK